MIELSIVKAADPKLPDLTITFTEPPPRLDSLTDAGRFYDEEAAKLGGLF